MTAKTAKTAQAPTAMEVDLWVTLTPTRGNSFGLVVAAQPDGSARARVCRSDHPEEVWTLPAGTTFADVMERCHRLLTEG